MSETELIPSTVDEHTDEAELANQARFGDGEGGNDGGNEGPTMDSKNERTISDWDVQRAIKRWANRIIERTISMRGLSQAGIAREIGMSATQLNKKLRSTESHKFAGIEIINLASACGGGLQLLYEEVPFLENELTDFFGKAANSSDRNEVFERGINDFLVSRHVQISQKGRQVLLNSLHAHFIDKDLNKDEIAPIISSTLISLGLKQLSK